jgi:hypothetical protein
MAEKSRMSCLKRLSSVTAKPRKAPSSRNMQIQGEAGASTVKATCHATSKHHPICHPYPARAASVRHLLHRAFALLWICHMKL